MEYAVSAEQADEMSNSVKNILNSRMIRSKS